MTKNKRIDLKDRLLDTLEKLADENLSALTHRCIEANWPMSQPRLN